MVDDGLAVPCTDNVGVANSVGVCGRWVAVHGWSVLLFVGVVLLGVTCFAWGYFVVFLLRGDPGVRGSAGILFRKGGGTTFDRQPAERDIKLTYNFLLSQPQC